MRSTRGSTRLSGGQNGPNKPKTPKKQRIYADERMTRPLPAGKGVGWGLFDGVVCRLHRVQVGHIIAWVPAAQVLSTQRLLSSGLRPRGGSQESAA